MRALVDVESSGAATLYGFVQYPSTAPYRTQERQHTRRFCGYKGPDNLSAASACPFAEWNSLIAQTAPLSDTRRGMLTSAPDTQVQLVCLSGALIRWPGLPRSHLQIPRDCAGCVFECVCGGNTSGGI